MGSFAAKLLKIPHLERTSTEDDVPLHMPPIPPTGNMAGNMEGNMMMQSGPQGFFPMGAMNPMMGMMGPGPEMMAMGNVGNMGSLMMFGGVRKFFSHIFF